MTCTNCTCSSSLAPVKIGQKLVSGLSGSHVEFRVSWSPLPCADAYELNIYSYPRQFEFEQVRVLTATNWTISVPVEKVSAGTKIYASVRMSAKPATGVITIK